jgi:hypothetical protein
MAKSKEEIKKEIKAHIAKEGSGYKNWYVGITNDVNRRLHKEHNVPEKNAWFITRPANSVEEAREIEEYFHDLGCDGAGGGGDEDSEIVYAYKKTSNTKE